MQLPSFNPNETPGTNFEEGYQEQVRKSLPDVFLSPLYAIGPASSKALFHEGITATLIDLALTNYYDYTDTTPDLSPAEIKQKYGFDSKKPLSNSAAQYIANRNKQLADIDNKFKSIEQRFLTDAITLASSIGAGFLDPANLLIFGVASNVLGRVGSAALSGSKAIRNIPVASRVSSFLLEDSFSSNVVKGAISGTFDNAIQAPFRIERAREFGRDYSLTEDLVSGAVFGSAFGALHYGINRLTGKPNTPRIDDPDIISKVREFSDNPIKPDTGSGLNKGLILAGETATALNKRPDIVPFQQLESRLNSPKLKARTNYEYTPLKPEDVKLTTFYNPHIIQEGNIGLDTQARFNEHFGRGILLTDSEALGSSLSDSGTLLVADVAENVKFFHTSERLDVEIKGELLDIFSEYMPREEALTFIDSPFKNIVEEANIVAAIEGNTEINERINKVFKDKGFAGFVFEGNTSEGPHNGLFVFEPESLKVREFRYPKETVLPDDFTKSSIEEYRQALLDYRNDIDYDPEYDVMANVSLDDNFESVYITTKIKQEMTTIAQDITELNKISGIGSDVTIDEVVGLASDKVLRGYRGKSALIEEVQKAIDAEVASLSDTFGIPTGLIDQRKLILGVKENLLKGTAKERPDIELKFLDSLVSEIDKITEVFDIPVEQLNQEQLIAVARRKVMKDLDLNTDFDKVREATKALINCSR